MSAIEYSQRLGVIRPEQFQAALDRFGLGRFLHAEPVRGGLFGQNVVVSSSAGEFVLRGRPHYDWQFPAERFYARLLHERTDVPVPWPYLLDPSPEIFGWSYVLMPRMPGLQLSDAAVVATLAPADRLGIARALGENLARVQALTWPVSGRYDLTIDTIAPFPEGFKAWLPASMREHLTLARGYNDRTTDADIAWAEEVIAAAGEVLDEPNPAVFTQTDYKEQNCTVERDNHGWRVSGLFDLMEGRFGDGELDLCRQIALYLDEDPALARVFIRAYLERRPARTGLLRRLPVYMLRERLIAWEYWQRPGYALPWDATFSLQAWAGPYLSALPALMDG